MVDVSGSVNLSNQTPVDDRNIVSRIARNSFVVLAAKGIEISASMVILMILSRVLGLSRFGDYAFINSLVLAFQPLVNLELNTILIREMARNRKGSRQFLGGGLLLKLILIGLFIIAAIILDTLLQMETVMRIAFYLAVVGEVFQQISWVFSAVFMSRERMEFEPLLSLIYRVISVGGILLLAFLCPEDVRLVTGFLLVFAILAAAQIVRAFFCMVIAARFLKSFRIMWSGKTALQILQQSWIMGIATFCTGLSLRVDVFFLKHFAGSDAVALFHLPHMVTLQIQIIATSIVTALFPVMSRWGGNVTDRDRFNRAQDTGLRVMTVLGLVIALGAALFPNWIIRLLGGASFSESAQLLTVLCWCIPILFLNYLGANLLTALKRQHLLIYGAAISLVLNAVLDRFLIPNYGPMGAAGATVFSYGIQLVIVFGFLKRSSGKSLRLMNIMVLPWVVVIAGASLAWFLDGFTGPETMTGILIRLSIGIVVAVVLGIQIRRVVSDIQMRGRR